MRMTNVIKFGTTKTRDANSHVLLKLRGVAPNPVTPDDDAALRNPNVMPNPTDGYADVRANTIELVAAVDSIGAPE
jgi:hypothetical protein